ncbi:VanZ family protein [Cellulomonas sp. NS3]|uniref:VanZ family protein n=1 Tax=Cellulomonas sp. NS3 TaxID=2973977 RepID=UPI0021614F06|nr:VanZ family protein [Cellulomonas sp. NS3]
MDVWVWPAYFGVLVGVLTFALLLVPILAYQYRRYGQFSVRRVVGAAAVGVYGTALFAYTLLPLPASRGDWCATAAAGSQWRPLHFVADIAQAGAGPSGLLTSRVTLQVLFNVILFVPWGLMVRGFWGRSLTVATASGLLVSALIEGTQLSGVWGIYQCAYRVADVDDLLANTLGALLGAALARWVLWWVPSPHSFDATRQLPRPVTSARRWLGMALDLTTFHVLGYTLLIGYRMVVLAATGHLPSRSTLAGAALYTLLPALCVFLLPAWAGGNGASLGQRAVRLVPLWAHAPSPGRRLARAAAIAGPYALALFCARWQAGTALGDAAQLLANALLLAAFIAVPLTQQRGLSAVLTGAHFDDERAQSAAPAHLLAEGRPTREA